MQQDRAEGRGADAAHRELAEFQRVVAGAEQRDAPKDAEACEERPRRNGTAAQAIRAEAGESIAVGDVLMANSYLQVLDAERQLFDAELELARIRASELLNLVQLYRKNRFLGVDRIADTDQLSIGVTSRVLDAESGRELVTATIGQARFEARSDGRT